MTRHDLFGPLETYIISSSGGLGSAISAIVAWQQGLRFELVFADTLIEDEDLYRFLVEVAAVVNKPIHWLKDGRDPWEIFELRKFIGNTRTAHCSEILKFNQVQAWANQHASATDPIVLGMDWSELDRIELAATKWAPRPVVSLINDYGVRRPMWNFMLARYGLRIPRLYEMGFPHNNCGGFCVRAGLQQFATLLTKMPDRYAYHERRMNETMARIGSTARPFLRHVVKGVTHYLTLTQFREMYQAGTIEVDPFDYGGCGCFTE